MTTHDPALVQAAHQTVMAFWTEWDMSADHGEGVYDDLVQRIAAFGAAQRAEGLAHSPLTKAANEYALGYQAGVEAERERCISIVKEHSVHGSRFEAALRAARSEGT